MTDAISLARKRERKHRRSMERSRPDGAFNPDSYDHRAELAHASAVKAVQGAFSHLPTAQIINPPRAYKDAQFARQIAIHIMVHGLGIEQRQICRMQGRQRTSIHFAIRSVEQRLECAVFRAAYERMKSDARARLVQQAGLAA